MSVYRVYVEKRSAFAVEAGGLLREINEVLRIPSVTGVRVLNRYDTENLSREDYESCLSTVYAEPQLDETYFELPKAQNVFAVEYLPGQYDQRAASCEECIQLKCRCPRPTVRTARVYILEGNVSAEDTARIKKYLINPVEAREASLDEKTSLTEEYPVVDKVETLTGFRELKEEDLSGFVAKYGLAMDADDLRFCRDYFLSEKRDPTITELRMIDTYWSDHCRHTTFLTEIGDAKIDPEKVQAAFGRYLAARREVYGEKAESRPVTLMDIATIGAKVLRKRGLTPNIDVSDEINACSIVIDADVDGETQKWLLMFKNETHNHPTEIEPFGGAATCIGGAIRDPLSGRAYVYQAMRVTGAADPTVPVEDTLPGKLPQRKLVTTAAAGYSSYGNQIGLATGLVDEIYHPGYAAKRLEIGAVVGAAPLSNVRREEPKPGDVVVLLGGRTGRDGIGGATGSSKSHKLTSIETCGAEVQKGNAPTERKLQRLFRDGNVTRLIKRCNDFGAGGVSVAIGELADGLTIDLDAVPRKYEGLDGTEIAISESQERMAVVLDEKDVGAFLEAAKRENLEATPVARVTEEKRLKMHWKGNTVVDIGRDFLSSNGARKTTRVHVKQSEETKTAEKPANVGEKLKEALSTLNLCSKQGLSERFDSTIGAGTVLMPFGGKTMCAPEPIMVAKIPVLKGDTETVSGMSYAFHPEFELPDPYTGSYLAVVESVSKLVAGGFDYTKCYLTLQEYFEKLGSRPERWGKPFSALLGALDAQLNLNVAAIGGKDSMSGSFEKLDVPPTLCSFAIAPGTAEEVLTAEFKRAGSQIRLLKVDPFDAEGMKNAYKAFYEAARSGKVLSARAVSLGGISEALFKLCVGNRLGASVSDEWKDELFKPLIGSVVFECEEGVSLGVPLGSVLGDFALEVGNEKIDLNDLLPAWDEKLEGVFPRHLRKGETAEEISFRAENRVKSKGKFARPRAFIPVFPGTNCEYDTARALERAGGSADIMVVNNLSPENITESLHEAARRIRESQMVILPGGFSGGDEPDGSAKMIAAFFKNPEMKDAVSDLMEVRGGLMLGICNGFQALIKLGLVPFGRIVDTDANCPTLTYNEIGRHQSMIVRTRVSSNLSPWLSKCEVGQVHLIPISHGEGRFVCPPELLSTLVKNGQIATQYVDAEGRPSMDSLYNPNASTLAVEGITSPDGRILGKMAHTERSGKNLYKNIPGDKFQPLFEGGVAYFA